MKILVFGNPLVQEDSIAIRVASLLKGRFEFKFVDAAEEIESEGKNPVILDAVEGVRKVELIQDLDRLQTSPVYSMHDFDLGIALKLLKKVGKIKSVRIIAIPKNYEVEKAAEEAERLLTPISP